MATIPRNTKWCWRDLVAVYGEDRALHYLSELSGVGQYTQYRHIPKDYPTFEIHDEVPIRIECEPLSQQQETTVDGKWVDIAEWRKKKGNTSST